MCALIRLDLISFGFIIIFTKTNGFTQLMRMEFQKKTVSINQFLLPTLSLIKVTDSFTKNENIEYKIGGE
jgi:hypothetical protein